MGFSSYGSALNFIAQMMLYVGHISLPHYRTVIVKSMFISCLLCLVPSPVVWKVL